MQTIERYLACVKSVLSQLKALSDIQIILTGANADFGGERINDLLRAYGKQQPASFKYFDSLGQVRYLSTMREVYCLIGNSSSGIVEAPFLRKPVLNIGNRQKGRHISSNIISVPAGNVDIAALFGKIDTKDFRSSLGDDISYYGDGNTSGKILEVLKRLV